MTDLHCSTPQNKSFNLAAWLNSLHLQKMVQEWERLSEKWSEAQCRPHQQRVRSAPLSTHFPTICGDLRKNIGLRAPRLAAMEILDAALMKPRSRRRFPLRHTRPPISWIVRGSGCQSTTKQSSLPRRECSSARGGLESCKPSPMQSNKSNASEPERCNQFHHRHVLELGSRVAEFARASIPIPVSDCRAPRVVRVTGGRHCGSQGQWSIAGIFHAFKRRSTLSVDARLRGTITEEPAKWREPQVCRIDGDQFSQVATPRESHRQGLRGRRGTCALESGRFGVLSREDTMTRICPSLRRSQNNPCTHCVPKSRRHTQDVDSAASSVVHSASEHRFCSLETDVRPIADQGTSRGHDCA